MAADRGAHDVEVAEARAEVAQSLLDAARRWGTGRPEVGVLYSGGLDSSLTARLLASHTSVTLWSMGLAGAKDPPAAREGAGVLGLPIHEIPLSVSDVRDHLAIPRSGWDDRPEPIRSVRLSVFLALRGCGATAVGLGQGADELFYGYARYAQLPADEAVRSASADYNRLVDEEWPWAAGIAASLGKEIGSLFLDPDVRKAACRLPPPRADLGEPPKVHLRAVARSLGLPETLVDRPKRALQYGTGIDRVVRRESAARQREGRGPPATLG